MIIFQKNEKKTNPKRTKNEQKTNQNQPKRAKFHPKNSPALPSRVFQWTIYEGLFTLRANIQE
jgi:hypothetical protein